MAGGTRVFAEAGAVAPRGLWRVQKPVVVLCWRMTIAAGPGGPTPVSARARRCPTGRGVAREAGWARPCARFLTPSPSVRVRELVRFLLFTLSVLLVRGNST